MMPGPDAVGKTHGADVHVKDVEIGHILGKLIAADCIDGFNLATEKTHQVDGVGMLFGQHAARFFLHPPPRCARQATEADRNRHADGLTRQQRFPGVTHRSAVTYPVARVDDAVYKPPISADLVGKAQVECHRHIKEG